MEPRIVLLDSSVIIEFFRKSDKTQSFLFRFLDHYSFALSVITLFEFQIGIKTEKQKNEFGLLTDPMDILTIDADTIGSAVFIYNHLKQRNALVELADILIAATAIRYDLPLATLNRSHFHNIPGLKLID